MIEQEVSNNKTENETQVYLPELLRWFRDFIRAAHELSNLLDIAPCELDTLAALKDGYFNAGIKSNKHYACPYHPAQRPEGNIPELQQEFFQAVRFLVARLKTHHDRRPSGGPGHGQARMPVYLQRM